jgi:hypothetical protein
MGYQLCKRRPPIVEKSFGGSAIYSAPWQPLANSLLWLSRRGGADFSRSAPRDQLQVSKDYNSIITKSHWHLSLRISSYDAENFLRGVETKKFYFNDAGNVQGQLLEGQEYK